jgi:serine/threonine protein kinase
MNQPHDRNVTTDIPSALADCLRPGDPLLTTDQARGSSSTDGSRPGADAPVSDVPAVPGYRVRREIARGGMGRVFAALDLALERDVALKILVPGANADRFVRESKITARLPHPGIPPVHTLGTLADGSPFLAMKLIAGQTLAEEMKTADRPRLLQAFTQVCQAVGFAHSRGVIHRDLKPANVMVGAFGEVQVMDWGLAKDLTSREVMDEPRASEAQTVPIVGTDANQMTDHRAPGASTDDRTHAGQVLGTPAYMAPEQARGEAADARADVFALGGILCAILTGQPPFSGKSMLETIQRAGAADLAETLARLDGSGVDGELLALCRRCLSPNPVDRPANGQAVADGLTAYLHGVQERLQTAERESAVAVARQRAHNDARAAELVKSLASSDTAFVTRIVEELTPYRSQAQAALAEMLANAKPDSKERLHASLALLPSDPSHVEYLRERLLTATPAEIIVLRQALSEHAADVNPKLWTVAEDKTAAMDQRLRALAALAGLASESERWQPLAAPLAQRLVAESPVLIGPWVEVFRPARLHLLEPLSTLCRKPLAEGEQANLEHSLAEFQQRSVAVGLVVDYASDQPQRLADLLMDADARQFVVLWPPFAKVSDQGVPALLKELNLKLADVEGQAAKERLAKRQANAAVALLRLGKPEQVWPILKHSPDPRVRSYLIHYLSPKGAAPQTLIARLKQENDLTVQRALILSLGEYGEQELPPDARNALLPKLQEMYRTASDPGLHAACEWLLRRWKQEAWLTKVNEAWAKDKEQREKRLEGIKKQLASRVASAPGVWTLATTNSRTTTSCRRSAIG